jgi:hypothetical protein
MTSTFVAHGNVLGELWAEGPAGMPFRSFSAASLKEIKALAKQKLEDGSLHEGDFQYLIGAYVRVTETQSVILNGREFTADILHEFFIGNLSKRNKEFLRNLDF